MTKRYPVDAKLEIRVLRLRVDSLGRETQTLQGQLDMILKAMQKAGMSGASYADM